MGGGGGRLFPRAAEDSLRSIMERLIKDMHDGQQFTTDEELTNAYQRIFEKALKAGLPASFDLSSGPDEELYTALQNNITIFSKGKTRTVLDEMRKLLPDPETQGPRSFTDFRDQVLTQIDATYNQDWLRTEYDTALASADGAVRWAEIERDKEALPLLQYSAVLDDNTRAEHAALDGVTLPVDHPFWDTWYPPNGWGCRCTILQLAEGSVTSPEKLAQLGQPPALFQFNPGKSETLFPPNHEYYQAA